MAPLCGKPGRPNHNDEEMFKLLDYQRDAACECVEHLTAGHLPLLVLPTGAGKTEVAIELAARLSNEGRSPLFVADRHSLLQNFRERTRARSRGCDAAMAQSAVKQLAGFWEKYDVVILDEAHELRRELLLTLIGRGLDYIGMTATPFTKGLSNFYDHIVGGPSTDDMIKQGRLIRPRAVEENWSGDYRTAFNRLSLLGPALAFVPPRQLQACVSACREAGFSADYIRSGLPPDKIEDAISRFEYGDTQVLVSVVMLSRDYNNPAVRHALDFAKQTSFGLHVQKLGCIMRTAPDKLVARYHDFTGNWQRFRDAREQFWAHGVRDWPDVARYQM